MLTGTVTAAKKGVKNIAKAAGIKAQIEEELAIIGDVGYEEYFLVVWDLLQDCRQHGIDWLTRGSAADSQHLACELVSKFQMERAALPSIALSVNTSILTAVGNDYSFDHVFTRQVEAWTKPGDVVVGISTSGNSGNVIAAIQKAKEMGAVTVAFTGEGGGKQGLGD